MKRFFVVAGLLIFSGCAAAPVVLKSDKGDLVKCEAGTGAVLIGGYVGSKYQVNKCIEQYEAAGYKRVK